ncbi:hypothetical protein BH09MYX1_BH09MYX1_38440 [soil metagenome]
MSEDELRKRILSRRAKFVAAAIAATGIAACGGDVQGASDASTDAPADASKDASKDTGADAPQPCLGISQPDAGDAGPQVCLAPQQDGG